MTLVCLPYVTPFLLRECCMRTFADVRETCREFGLCWAETNLVGHRIRSEVQAGEVSGAQGERGRDGRMVTQGLRRPQQGSDVRVYRAVEAMKGTLQQTGQASTLISLRFSWDDAYASRRRVLAGGSWSGPRRCLPSQGLAHSMGWLVICCAPRDSGAYECCLVESLIVSEHLGRVVWSLTSGPP